MNKSFLIRQAFEASELSVSPYSGFKVGAALLCENGQIYKGCNIENTAFSETICAERCAVFKAVSEGITKFSAIAVVGYRQGEPPEYCYPCGACRQVLCEFCDDNFIVIAAKTEEDYKEFSLGGLLPERFK